MIRAELLEQQAASLFTRLVSQDQHGEAASDAKAVCVHRQQRPATLAELQIEAGCDCDSITDLLRDRVHLSLSLWRRARWNC